MVKKTIFHNKVVLITGGSSGLGKTYTNYFLEEGAIVISCSRRNNFKNKFYTNNHKFYYYKFDLKNIEKIKVFIRKLSKKFKKIDILINNAGIAGPSYKTWEYPIDQWQNVIDIDLTGLFYCCRSVVPHMIKANYGRIVNIASIAGKEGNPNAMPYSAAKAGVIALTKSLGKELADKNIAVNCVTPAAAKTRIFDQISQEHIDYMLSKIPRGRFIKVDELASMVSWLVSEENSYTTGAVFDLSGGRATY